VAQITALFTCVGGTMAPSALVDLRQSARIPLRLIGVDRNPHPIAARFLDGFAQVPPGSDPGYIDSVLQVVRSNAVDVFVPWSDEESIAVASARARFVELGCMPVVSPADVLATICDKQLTYEAMAAAGLRTTDFRVAVSVDEALECLRDFDVPRHSAVIKPPRGRGGRGLVFVEGRDDPAQWLGSGARERRVKVTTLDDGGLREAIGAAMLEGGKLLVMPALDVPVYDVDLLAKDGHVSALTVRRRHNPAGIPFAGNTIVIDRDIEGYCREIARAMRLSSLHDLDLMTDKRRRVVLLEINPRMSGSIAASIAAGVPFLELAIAQAAGITYPHPWQPPRANVDVLPLMRAVVAP
jgi:carbamoylphosphate synthase large subunit